jgi:hypothetical protein
MQKYGYAHGRKIPCIRYILTHRPVKADGKIGSRRCPPARNIEIPGSTVGIFGQTNGLFGQINGLLGYTNGLFGQTNGLLGYTNGSFGQITGSAFSVGCYIVQFGVSALKSPFFDLFQAAPFGISGRLRSWRSVPVSSV